MTPIAVVGGGIAGLACALALADAGLPVRLVERSLRFGGRAASWLHAASGDMVDVGPHVILSDYRNLRAWLRRLGTEARVQWQRQPLITLHDGPRVRRMPASRLPPPLHGLPCLPGVLGALGPAALLSNLRVAWRALRLDEAGTLALDGRDALGWLREAGVSERAIAWFWASAALALLNVPLERCSAASLMRPMRLMLGRSGAQFGFAGCGLAELFVPGTLAALRGAGAQVASGVALERVLLRAGRVEALQLSSGERVAAERCVLALPPQALAAVAPADWQGADALPARAAAMRGSPYLSSYLWLDRPLDAPRGGERFWARVWSSDNLNTDFYDLAHIRRPRPAAPALVACNAIHALHAWEWSDEEILRRSQAEIAAFAPAAGAARLVHGEVHRIPMAIPCPWPGFESARPETATPYPGLWLAGDWTRTGLPCSMESAVRSGWLAAEAVAADCGRPLRLALPVPETTGLPGLLRRVMPWRGEGA